LSNVPCAHRAEGGDVVSRLYRSRWTFVGVQTFPGCMVLFLVNGPDKSTVSMVAYDDAHPVRITEAS
jgi:hypothetical protein